jgi:hypothetical protein
MRDSKLWARWIRKALQVARKICVEAAMMQDSDAASQGMIECNTDWFVTRIESQDIPSGMSNAQCSQYATT